MFSIKKTIRTMAKPLIFLAAALILSACGSDIEGTYSSKHTQIELNSGGKGYLLSRMGNGNGRAIQYEVDGKRIVVTIPGVGNSVYTLMDNGDLKYRGYIYKKKRIKKAEIKSNTQPLSKLKDIPIGDTEALKSIIQQTLK